MTVQNGPKRFVIAIGLYTYLKLLRFKPLLTKISCFMVLPKIILFNRSTHQKLPFGVFPYFRSINYDERDPFLCNACGFCKYAKFDYNLTARPCCAVDPIESEEDRKKVVTKGKSHHLVCFDVFFQT